MSLGSLKEGKALWQDVLFPWLDNWIQKISTVTKKESINLNCYPKTNFCTAVLGPNSGNHKRCKGGETLEKTENKYLTNKNIFTQNQPVIQSSKIYEEIQF